MNFMRISSQHALQTLLKPHINVFSSDAFSVGLRVPVQHNCGFMASQFAAIYRGAWSKYHCFHEISLTYRRIAGLFNNTKTKPQSYESKPGPTQQSSSLQAPQCADTELHPAYAVLSCWLR